MTITVVSKVPAGGRCTLYARYAEALSPLFGMSQRDLVDGAKLAEPARY